MNIFDLIRQELSNNFLQEVARQLTVENDPTLSYPGFFPATSTPSVKLATITPVENAYISDRREWNADGRYIPTRLPAVRQLEMVPLEAWDAIDEREIQLLAEAAGGNADIIIRNAKISIGDRINALVQSNIWANEYESLRAWFTGEIPVLNPQTGASYVADVGIDDSRYVTDTTPWDETNAFERLQDYANEARDAIGSIGGILVRSSIARLIASAAPNIGSNDVPMTLRQAGEYLSDSLGTPFEIRIDERAKPKFTGAGTETVSTKLVPEDTIAFLPGDGRVGYTYQAPIYRAEDISAVSHPDSQDRDSQRVYQIAMNHGKSLKIQAHANWLAVPDEQRVFVVNITQA